MQLLIQAVSQHIKLRDTACIIYKIRMGFVMKILLPNILFGCFHFGRIATRAFLTSIGFLPFILHLTMDAITFG